MSGRKSSKKGGDTRHTMLRIESPQGHVWLVDLLGDSYVLGRGDPSGGTHVDFQVPEDGFLSRVHLKLFRDGDGYAIENLSPNGTLVDGSLLEQPRRLTGKERIEAGKGTTATYLVVTEDQRRHLAEEKSGIKERRAETGGIEEAAPRPFYTRPIFLGMFAFYGLLAIVILGFVGKKEAGVGDPGSGPYFAKLLSSPVVTERPESDAQADADRMWEAAMRLHGGALLAENGHAYALVLQARQVAGVMGYGTLGQALDKGEPFAQRAQLVLDDLEKRAAALHAEAQGYIDGRHWDLAYAAYARLADLVPDSRSPLRRFAVTRMAKLRKMR